MVVDKNKVVLVLMLGEAASQLDDINEDRAEDIRSMLDDMWYHFLNDAEREAVQTSTRFTFESLVNLWEQK